MCVYPGTVSAVFKGAKNMTYGIDLTNNMSYPRAWQQDEDKQFLLYGACECSTCKVGVSVCTALQFQLVI